MKGPDHQKGRCQRKGNHPIIVFKKPVKTVYDAIADNAWGSGTVDPYAPRSGGGQKTTTCHLLRSAEIIYIYIYIYIKHNPMTIYEINCLG